MQSFSFFFTSEKNIRGIIYMIRDPRDVCISWAYHTGKTYDQSIKSMLNDFQSEIDDLIKRYEYKQDFV